jgi:hypothetical protein
MSFWSALAKIGLGVAAPFTGGATLAGIPLIDAAGRVASGISAGRAAGRQEENQNALNFLRAPGMNARNSVQGDILANVQPATVNGPITGTHGNIPQITGGLSPSLLSQNTRRLGSEMSRKALLAQMSGGLEPKKGNALDAILNGIGYAGLGTSVLGQYGPQRQPRPSIPQLPMTGRGIPGIPMQPPDPYRPRY